MAGKEDNFGISESSLQHLIDAFKTISETFNDILIEGRKNKKAAPTKAAHDAKAGSGAGPSPLNPNV